MARKRPRPSTAGPTMFGGRRPLMSGVDPDLRELLLSRRALGRLKAEAGRAATTSRHRAAWARQWAKMAETEREVLAEVRRGAAAIATVNFSIRPSAKLVASRKYCYC